MGSNEKYIEFISTVREIYEVSSSVHNEKITIDKETGEVLNIERLDNPLGEDNGSSDRT